MKDIQQTYEVPFFSRLAMKYRNRRMIASVIFPWIPVSAKGFKYPKFDRGVTFKPAQTKYGPRSKPNELEIAVTKVSHVLTKRGLGAHIDHDERKLSEIGDIRAWKMQALIDAMLLDLEREVAGQMFNAANYAAANKATLSGTDQFDNAASDPKQIVMEAGEGLLVDPNTVVVGSQVDIALRTNPKVRSEIFGTVGNAGDVNDVQLARYFGVERYIVGGGRVDTAAEGQAESLGRIWGKFLWIGHINYANANANGFMNDPSFGSLPISTEGSVTGSPWRVYSKAPDPETGFGDGMEYVKVDAEYDPLFQAWDLGYLFSAAVS